VLEPEPYLRTRAELAPNALPVEVTVRGGLAETLPAEAASVDAAIASMVPCSVACLQKVMRTCSLLAAREWSDAAAAMR
jgi:hypothetical protein